jgi:hypothetical protein
LIQNSDPIFGQKGQDYALPAADVQYLERTGTVPEPLYYLGNYPVTLMLIKG